MIALFRGKGDEVSIVGAKTCNSWDYTLLAFFFMGTVLFYMVGTRIVHREVNEKIFLRYNFIDGDLTTDKSEYRKLAAYGLFGGFIAGGSGLGAVLFFQPIVLAQSVHSAVAAETGNYLSLFSATTSTVTVILLGKLQW